jgi:superfamily II RNA helicase
MQKSSSTTMGGGLRSALVDRHWQWLVALLLVLYHVCIDHGCRAFQASTFPANAPKSSKQKIDNDDGSSTIPKNKNPAQPRIPRTKTNPDGTSDRTFTTPQQPQQQQQQQLHADEWIATAQERLASHFPFALDDWQLYAGGAICHGYNVVVSAPTGAG